MATSIPHQGGLTPSTSGQGQSGQAGQGSSSASGLVDKLAQNAEQTAAKAIDRVKESRGRAEQGLEKQHEKITSRIRGLGDALRSSSESLEDNEQVSALLNIASEQVDRVAQYVDTATPRSVARDIERFAREKPAWFFGGAFLAGLALGRFAKSSAESSDDGLRFSEGDLESTGRYPQARGGASATYASQTPYQRSTTGTQPGSSYSGYTTGGGASSSGPYTGSSSSSSSAGTSGGTTQRMGSSYPSGASSSGYTGGAGTSAAPSTTSPVSGSSGYSTGPSGGSYSGTSGSSNASNPSSTPSSSPGSSQSAPRSPNNGGTSGASKS